MSNAYAIAGVTAVLQGLVEQGVLDLDLSTPIGSSVSVSALPPDRVDGDAQINIFLYQVTPNLGWRNECLPSRNARSERLTNQPLALDLHYIVTAYGADDLFAEMMLGTAMQVLHERPFLDREVVQSLLSPPPLPDTDPILEALFNSGLADQYEQIKITPEYLNKEDMSKLWSAFQSNYRPSATYMATVVLIEAQAPTRTPLPVLTRGPVDPITNQEQGIIVQPSLLPPTPTLTEVIYPNAQIAIRLGETLTLQGHHLSGTNVNVRMVLRKEQVVIDLAPLPGATDTELQVLIPNVANDWRVGLYEISVTLEEPVGNVRETNRLALSLAPAFSGVAIVRNPDDSVTVNLATSPAINDDQEVAFIVGQHQQLAQAFSGQVTNATFIYEELAAANYWARLRVDGIESLLIDRSSTPPQFFASQSVTVPV